MGASKTTTSAESGGPAVSPESFEAPFEWGMVYLLARIFYGMRDRTEATLRPHNLTPMQFTILASLERWQDLTSAELSRRFKVTPQTMGEMIANLERRGLVVRREHPSNRRALRVALTAEGVLLLDACNARVRDMEADLFGAFTPKELAELRARLATLHLRLGPDAGVGG
jgi:DNA-binding MarR family transcriptional regulator